MDKEDIKWLYDNILEMESVELFPNFININHFFIKVTFKYDSVVGTQIASTHHYEFAIGKKYMDLLEFLIYIN